MDLQLPSELSTQPRAVLRLLSTCPILEDPEKWSLWSLCPTSLVFYWGSFDEFLIDHFEDSEGAFLVIFSFRLQIYPFSLLLLKKNYFSNPPSLEQTQPGRDQSGQWRLHPLKYQWDA